MKAETTLRKWRKLEQEAVAFDDDSIEVSTEWDLKGYAESSDSGVKVN